MVDRDCGVGVHIVHCYSNSASREAASMLAEALRCRGCFVKEVGVSADLSSSALQERFRKVRDNKRERRGIEASATCAVAAVALSRATITSAVPRARVNRCWESCAPGWLCVELRTVNHKEVLRGC